MKDDSLLIQCEECYVELERENIHYAYGHILCISCLMQLGEEVRTINNQGVKWDEERITREDN